MRLTGGTRPGRTSRKGPVTLVHAWRAPCGLRHVSFVANAVGGGFCTLYTRSNHSELAGHTKTGHGKDLAKFGQKFLTATLRFPGTLLTPRSRAGRPRGTTPPCPDAPFFTPGMCRKPDFEVCALCVLCVEGPAFPGRAPPGRSRPVRVGRQPSVERAC